MAKQSGNLKNAADDAKHFARLKPFIERAAIGEIRKGRMFVLCVKASIAKCYEFNQLVRGDAPLQDAFFLLPALRGVCEDLIVLKYLQSIPAKEREELVSLLMSHDVQTRIKFQDKFFTAARPQQPVLRVKDADTAIEQLESKIRAIWNAHGWPGLNRGAMPQIRQIAEKQGEGVLATLYDYLYRLTSGTVHFNVQSLLRSGWGASKKQFTFSTKHFHPYFLAFGRVYGAFLFCLYFEFFRKVLGLNAEALEAVGEIRKSLLLESRWPEMVTFEEMNLEPPKTGILEFVYSFMQSEQKKRLIGK